MTPAWSSNDLPVNAMRYLRAQTDAARLLVLYMQGGTDADAQPASLKDTPGAVSGGDPDETVSSRVCKAAAAGSRFGRVLECCLDGIFEAWHYQKSVEADEGSESVARY